jgi:hypothetical protein
MKFAISNQIAWMRIAPQAAHTSDRAAIVLH